MGIAPRLFYAPCVTLATSPRTPGQALPRSLLECMPKTHLPLAAPLGAGLANLPPSIPSPLDYLSGSFSTRATSTQASNRILSALPCERARHPLPEERSVIPCAEDISEISPARIPALRYILSLAASAPRGGRTGNKKGEQSRYTRDL